MVTEPTMSFVTTLFPFPQRPPGLGHFANYPEFNKTSPKSLEINDRF